MPSRAAESIGEIDRAQIQALIQDYPAADRTFSGGFNGDFVCAATGLKHIELEFAKRIRSRDGYLVTTAAESYFGSGDTLFTAVCSRHHGAGDETPVHQMKILVVDARPGV